MSIAVYQPQSAADLLQHYANVRLRLAKSARDEEYERENAKLKLEIATLLARIAELENSLKNITISNEHLRIYPRICNDIMNAVCARWRVTKRQLISVRRTKDLTEPRQVAITICKFKSGASLPQIGRLFARDHTTVIHAIRQFSRVFDSLELEPDADISTFVDGMFSKIHPECVGPNNTFSAPFFNT